MKSEFIQEIIERTMTTLLKLWRYYVKYRVLKRYFL